MSILHFLFWFMVGYAIGLVISANAGWFFAHGRKGQPWNWRVLVGPATYRQWLAARTATPKWGRK